MLYMTFYRSNAAAFPMTLQAVVTYMWLRQAFLMLFETWGTENAILESITSGGVAYELARPAGIYGMWYVRTFSARTSKMLLRAGPVILVAILLPGALRTRPAVERGGVCRISVHVGTGRACSLCVYHAHLHRHALHHAAAGRANCLQLFGGTAHRARSFRSPFFRRRLRVFWS